jgi:hypothetical protein
MKFVFLVFCFLGYDLPPELKADQDKVGKNVQVRYLQLPTGLSDEERDRFCEITSFALNSISKSQFLTNPVVVGNYLRVNLDDCKIDPKTWDKFAKKHPYGSVIRADWFIKNATVAPAYYEFLGLKNIHDFNSLIGHDPKVSERFKSESRSLIATSSIARLNVMVSRIPTASGRSLYQSMHSKKDYFTNPLSDEYELKEMMGFLPNGLLAYFVTNRYGDALGQMDSELAIMPTGRDRRVLVGISCISCHANGPKNFNDGLKLFSEKDVEIVTPDSKIKENLERLFSTDWSKLIKRDSEDYQEAVRKLTGKDSEKIHKSLVEAIERYLDVVDLPQAAKESNMEVEDFRLMIRDITDPRLLRLMISPIRRESWEEVFPIIEEAKKRR